MTDAQLEAAARRLCGIRGVDPDWKLGPSHTQLDRAKYEVRAHLEVRQAIRDARADLDPKPQPQTFADRVREIHRSFPAMDMTAWDHYQEDIAEAVDGHEAILKQHCKDIADVAVAVQAKKPPAFNVRLPNGKFLFDEEGDLYSEGAPGSWACPACGKCPAVPSAKGDKCCTECANKALKQKAQCGPDLLEAAKDALVSYRQAKDLGNYIMRGPMEELRMAIAAEEARRKT